MQKHIPIDGLARNQDLVLFFFESHLLSLYISLVFKKKKFVQLPIVPTGNAGEKEQLAARAVSLQFKFPHLCKQSPALRAKDGVAF